MKQAYITNQNPTNSKEKKIKPAEKKEKVKCARSLNTCNLRLLDDQCDGDFWSILSLKKLYIFRRRKSDKRRT
jgi:hypothetical protein